MERAFDLYAQAWAPTGRRDSKRQLPIWRARRADCPRRKCSAFSRSASARTEVVSAVVPGAASWPSSWALWPS